MHVSDPCEQRFVFKWIKWRYTTFHTKSYSTSRIVRISLNPYRGKHIRKIGLQFIYIDNESHGLFAHSLSEQKYTLTRKQDT